MSVSIEVICTPSDSLNSPAGAGARHVCVSGHADLKRMPAQIPAQLAARSNQHFESNRGAILGRSRLATPMTQRATDETAVRLIGEILPFVLAKYSLSAHPQSAADPAAACKPETTKIRQKRFDF